METGGYLLMHLGDGIIIGKENQHVRVLSWPVSGSAAENVRNIWGSIRIIRIRHAWQTGNR